MKRSISLLLTVILLLPALQGLTAFSLPVSAAETGEDVLFESGFESSESRSRNEYLEGSGVVRLDYGVKGKGLKVRLDTVSGAEDYLGSENKYNLFDGKTATKFLTGASKGSIQFALEEPAAVNGYEIASANDEPTRDPKSWKLYGSDTGSNWILLDERSGESFASRFQTKLYTFENTLSCLWYKLEVTANAGGSMLQFSSLDLYDDAAAPVQNAVSVDLSTVQATTHYSNHTVENLFDGNTASKYLVMSSSTATVSFAMKNSVVLTSYALTSANDHDPRDPKDWDFYGSENGTDWVLLDSRRNEDFAARYQTNTYAVQNERSFKWYKLQILSNNGTDAVGLNIVQLAELEINPSAQADEETGFTVVKSSIEGTTALSGEGRENLFDRDEATKMVAQSDTMWVSFRIAEPQTVTAYEMVSANDWPERDPKAWKVYGSDNGTNWTLIDQRSDQVFSGRYASKLYRLSQSVNYSYYKLEVTEKYGINAYVQLSDFTLLTQSEAPESQPGMDAREDFGPTQTDTGKPGAWTGNACLAVFGEQTSVSNTFARTVVYDGLSIPVSENTVYRYLIFPALQNIKSYDYEYTSCRVLLDLHFTDGSTLTGLAAKDQHGSLLTPGGQVDGECLFTEQWNYIESRIGEVANGKTIDRIDAYFEMDAAEDASPFITFFDDICILNKAPTVYEHLSDYIDIRRGTNNDSAFSRGLCTPGVAMPNGFNFYTPVTNPSKNTASYNYQVNGENNPLDSISVIHAPSFWLQSYGTWQFMANTSVDPSGNVASAAISSDARKSKFAHENEIAHAHYYSVTLNEGTPASGVQIEITPTSHAAYVRFTFPDTAEYANVIFDSVWASGSVSFMEDGKSFRALTSHTSAGGGKMWVVGSFDTAWEKASPVGGKLGFISFPNGTKTVTMKFATSFLSYDQAQHSLDLEIGNKDFDGVFLAAQTAWDALCGKFEIEGASYTELLTFYSCLYRMYAYPNLYSENEGSATEPSWVYASPYRSGVKTSGILYTNNGFWDTYRTTWAGYTLFTQNKAGDMLNGLVQHYVDSGWIPRWICPGGANVMVGTSSDVIFADAYVKGIPFLSAKAWESMQKDASSYSSNLTAGGRKNNNIAPYLGYVSNDLNEGYSCSQANYLDDFGLYRMAQKLGLAAEEEYYYNRCLKYSTLFNKNAGFFMGKSTTGVFSASGSSYDPAAWGGPKGDYTESVGWVNAFPAVFDGEGMVDLYGGRQALAEKLNALFDDSIDSMRKVVTGVGHEICEFKEVKMGQYEHNNQPSHHVIYTYAFSSEPYRIQQYTREVLRHVYVGSEIGQGYPGDEDNGEMSAWYVFNALGFYPYCPASGEYVIGSPLFDKVTVHLDNGNDIVIKANNNSQENVYIQSATINGQAMDRLYLTHEELNAGCTIEYDMGETPSSFGSADSAKPFSLSSAQSVAKYESDLIDSATVSGSAYTGQNATADTQIFTGVSSYTKLFDQNSLTSVSLGDGAQIVLTGKKPSIVSLLTVTCDQKSNAPATVTLEASDDGSNWKKLFTKDLSFFTDKLILPVEVPETLRGSYRTYRATFSAGTVAEVEFYGSKGTNFEDPFGAGIRGDVNADGIVTIMDVTALLNFLSYSEEARAQVYEEGAYSVSANDIDTDGTVNITDVTALLNILSGVDTVDVPSLLPKKFQPGSAYNAAKEGLSVHFAYSFPDGDSAEGSVLANAEIASAFGEYTLLYGDDNGPMPGVTPLGSVNVQSAGTDYEIFHAGENFFPPWGAKTLLLQDEDGNIAAYEEIPMSKRMRGGALLGSFAAISDVHVFENEPYGGSYDSINGAEDLQRAVGVINAAGVDFTAITGDLILSFMSDSAQIRAELEKCTGILQDLEAPCYVVKGNHDKRVDETVWKKLTGCDLDYAFTFGNARFIFLSLLTVQNVGSVDESPYGEAKLDWLESELQSHGDQRVMLFMHYPVNGYAGLVPGSSYGFTSGSAEEARLLEMLKSHGGVTAFNGHTHFDFAAAKTYPDISVSRVETLNAYFVHLPSVAYPRNASNVTVTEESEGYIVRVLENGILLEAVDFVTGRIESEATLYLDTRLSFNAPTEKNVQLSVGETRQIETLLPAENASYASSDDSIVSVSDSGVLTALASGKATILCRLDGVEHRVFVTVLSDAQRMQGSGTKEDPYLLTSADHFVYIQDCFRSGNTLSGVYFAMDNDICLNDSADYRPAVSAEEGTFSGYFDGRGHTLSVRTEMSTDNFAVPYFYHVNGTIVNTVFACEMGGCAKTSYVVARTMNGGKLVNCILRGSVYANNVNTSIVCGTSSGAKIANCFIDVSLSGQTPGSSESGITMKGSGTVVNVLYVPNGCTAHFHETAVSDRSTVAAQMNQTISASASSVGVDASSLCAWTTINGAPALVS